MTTAKFNFDPSSNFLTQIDLQQVDGKNISYRLNFVKMRYTNDADLSAWTCGLYDMAGNMLIGQRTLDSVENCFRIDNPPYGLAVTLSPDFRFFTIVYG